MFAGKFENDSNCCWHLVYFDISSESVFSILRYDSEDDESVVVKNVNDDMESTMAVENLCRIVDDK